MKKLTILIPSLRGGGLEKSILTLATEIHNRGFDLDFVVVNTIDSAYIADPKLNLINLNVARIQYAIFPLLRYLLKTRPQILFSAGTPLNSLAIIAKLVCGYPKRLIVGERNHLSSIVKNTTRLRDKLRPLMVKYLYPNSDIVLAVSQDVADDIIQISNLDKKRVFSIHNIFDIDNIVAQAQALTDIPWLDTNQIPAIVNVGRLTPQKDQDTLLRAFSLVRSKKYCRLIILGEGKDRSKLQQLAEELNVSKDVLMPGFVKNPYAYIIRAKVLVLSSVWEGLPGALIEALACGTPVVSTDCPGGAAEILENGKYGLLTKIGNPYELAEAILATMDAPKRSDILYRRSKDFSIETNIQKYLDIFQLNAFKSENQ